MTRSWPGIAPTVLLLALWLFIPPFSREFGAFTLRHVELVRFAPLVLLVGLSLFRRSLGGNLRWELADGCVLLFCSFPFLAGILNGKGVTFSTWETIKECSYWGIPYLLGRISSLQPGWCRWFGHSLIALGLVYYLPTLYEVFNGPVIAKWLTGEDFTGMLRGAERGGTYKPSVLLSSGFVLTMFYVAGALYAYQQVLRSRALADTSGWDREAIAYAAGGGRWGYLAVFVAFTLLVLLCKSLGSIVLLGIGVAILSIPSGRIKWLFVALLCLVPVFTIAARGSGFVSTDSIDSIVRMVVAPERAGSFRYRLEAEDLVRERMTGHHAFGFGNWSDWHREGMPRALDGFWLFSWTRTGLVSVAGWLAMVIVPLAVLIRRGLRPSSHSSAMGDALPLALFLALSLIDSLSNYFGEAPWMMLLGGMATLGSQTERFAMGRGSRTDARTDATSGAGR